MTQHVTGTREEWLAARLALLDEEKELTRRSDELARRRQALPWVRVEKDYRFETDDGSASLADHGQRAPSDCGCDRGRPADVRPRGPRRERVRARGWGRPPHLLGLLARRGQPLGHVPMARPRPQGPQ